MILYNIRKVTLLLIVLMIGIYKANGQQQAMFTHYAFNTQAVNPAYAGTRDALTITTLYRAQWVGFEGAPTTMTLTMHTPILNNQIGAGLSVINDKIGPVSSTAVFGDAAYKLKVSQKGTLSLGIKGGFETYQFNYNAITLTQINDPSFTGISQSKIMPNAGGGAYYYSPTWYFGFSVPKIMQNRLSFFDGAKLAREKRHYFLIAGRVFDLGNNIKFKPTTYIKVTQGAPIEADLTSMLIIRDRIEVGVMFRTSDAMGLLFGLNISDQLRIGYSFDWSYGLSSGRYNFGSHEVMLRYDLIYKHKPRIRSPRYF